MSSYFLRGSWKVTQGGKYFVTRNDSCIAAFVVGGSFHSVASGFFIAVHKLAWLQRGTP